MELELFSNVYQWDNLLLAYRKASKGKRGKSPAASFEYKLEENLLDLQKELQTKTYKPLPYHSFYIHDPKKRLISAANFRDRVVHHALHNIINPIFEKSFIHDSYANRKSKGTHRAISRAQYFSRKFPYILSCDVCQYFPSIDHAILKDILNQKIKDTELLWLINTIIEGGKGILKSEYNMVWFPDDNLLSYGRPRGLPIGNLTSQFWANCYLNPFDHFVKRELKCKAYVRYVDDMLFFGNDKKEMWEWKQASIERLKKYRLTIHEKNAQVHPVKNGFPFLGFIVYPNKKRLKRRKVTAFRKKIKKMIRSFEKGIIPVETISASIKGWVAHAEFGNTQALRRTIFSNSVFQRNSSKGD